MEYTLTPDEIREALARYDDEPDVDLPDLLVLTRAARLYADLLENGQKKRAEQRELSVMPWVLIVPGPGRYLVVPVQEDVVELLDSDPE